jgi:hypothetical protein
MSAAVDRPIVIPKVLDEVIEAERAVLMKADAVLNCLALAMDYDDGSNIPRPYYGIIVELARDLVNDSITRLDSVNLGAALRGRQATRSKKGSNARLAMSDEQELPFERLPSTGSGRTGDNGR